jgi:hypothetical protein
MVLKIFDNKAWNGKDVGNNSQFWRPATVLNAYMSDNGKDIFIDVRFHHDGRISKGHFLDKIVMMHNVERAIP